VSWVTDIAELFSSGSVPVVVAGTVLGVFELGERFASQRAKDALSKWLVSFDVQRAKALPSGTQELFERIFGERHLSSKCFIRSVMFSSGAMVFLGILVFLIDSKAFFEMESDAWATPRFLGFPRWLPWTAVWLPWSVLVDYVSLLKTRVILAILTRMRLQYTILAVAILVVDYFVYKVIFAIGATLMFSVIIPINPVLQVGRSLYEPLLGFTLSSYFHFSAGVYFILFWSGFAPSIWMWLYVFALFVTRALFRSEKLVTWLRWGLDVEKAPFRSIGAVAAALAFIASVAVILVSVEVSRISATT
jgi:hypothetical protein